MPDSPGSNMAARIGLGCAAAMLAVFAIAGVAIVALGLYRADGPTIVIGLVFTAIPGAGLFFVRWAWRVTAEREQREAQAPDQAWTWKHDFHSGVVSGQSPRATVLVPGLFAAIWLGMIALMTTVGWDQVRADARVIAILALFWVVGFFLAGWAVKAILRARRYGASTASFDAVPARLGGWLSGVIHAPLAVHGAQVQVTVQCVETSHVGAGSDRRTVTTVLWRATRVLDGALLERQADRVEIPFAVKLPTNAEAMEDFNRGVISQVFAAKDRDLVGGDMDWYVDVSGRLPGVDYEDRFPAPVAAREPGAAVSPMPPRAMPELSGERLSERLPARLEHELDADVFVFPLKTSFVVWPLALGALAAGAVVFRDLPALANLSPATFKWTAIVSGGLAALALIGLFLDTRRIEVTVATVRIRRGVLGLGLHRTIPRQEIAAVDEETSRSDPPSYQVNIRLRNGKTYWASPSSSEPDRAAAVAARLRQVLQLS